MRSGCGKGAEAEAVAEIRGAEPATVLCTIGRGSERGTTNVGAEGLTNVEITVIAGCCG